MVPRNIKSLDELYDERNRWMRSGLVTSQSNAIKRFCGEARVGAGIVCLAIGKDGRSNEACSMRDVDF